MFALGFAPACSRVIGLGSDYYALTPQGGAAGEGTVSNGGAIVGVGGARSGGADAGEPGRAGSGGASDTVTPKIRCADYPLTPHAEWVASASNHFADEVPSNLIDDMPSRWSTGKPQSGDEWLQIDFGAPVALRSIDLEQQLEQEDDSNDYPRNYSITISDIAQDLMSPALFSGEGMSGAATLTTLSSPHVGRYLVVKQLGMSLSWWSVDELSVSCTDD